MGIVTLMMAVLLMACWIKSLGVRTEITFGRNQTNTKAKYKSYYNIQTKGWFSSEIETKVLHQLISSNGIMWRKLEVTNPDTMVGYPIGWRDTDYDAFKSFFSPDGIVWQRQLFGFEFGECHKGKESATVVGGDAAFLALSDPRLRMSFWFIPYWSTVIPLTLISLWLLLSKPSKSLQTTNVESAPESAV